MEEASVPVENSNTLTKRTGARERLRRVGREALSDAELVALLLGTGDRRESVAILSTRLLETVGGVEGLAHLGPGALEALGGVGPSKASRLIAAVELGRRTLTSPLQRGAPIRSSRDVYRALYPRLALQVRERFIALALDAKNRPLAELEIAQGGLSACPVCPSDVFRALLREASSAVIFVHNHPSGETTPSDDDLALTARLVAAGQLLGLRVLDHLIIGRDQYFSFLDEGLIDDTHGIAKAR